MNLREFSIFSIYQLRGQAFGSYYRQYLVETLSEIPRSTIQDQLRSLLTHCQNNIPYYAQIMKRKGGSFIEDPIAYLRELPILTKDMIHEQFKNLQSRELRNHHWLINSTGGSTGDSVQFVQDRDFFARAGAISILFSKLIGKELGEREAILWGSLHDIEGTTEGWQARLSNSISNRTFLSVYRLDGQTIRNYISFLNRWRPKIIIAYAGAIYEIARYAEREGIKVEAQNAIITSAGMLLPMMREKIEKVFRCKVYNRYGTREVGDVACERPGFQGLWVAPWGNFIEVVDKDGQNCPPGVEGDLLITSLSNYAMPLVRYNIGDRGMLAASGIDNWDYQGQVLLKILGRTNDMFINKQNNLVDGMLFLPLLAYKEWIRRYQVVQKRPDYIVLRIVKWGNDPSREELELIRSRAKGIMAAECQVDFEFVDEIPLTMSGKHRYIISEVGKG